MKELSDLLESLIKLRNLWEKDGMNRMRDEVDEQIRVIFNKMKKALNK